MDALNAQMDQAKADIIDLLNHRASTKGNIQRYDTMLEQVQIRKAQLSSRLLQLKSEEAQQKEETDVFDEKLRAVSEKIRELSEQSQQENDTHEKLQAQISGK